MIVHGSDRPTHITRRPPTTTHHPPAHQVSKCCLGTMTWGEQNTQAEGVEQLFMACDEMGLNFIDTAEMCKLTGRLPPPLPPLPPLSPLPPPPPLPPLPPLPYHTTTASHSQHSTMPHHT